MNLQFKAIFDEYYKRCRNKIFLKEFVIKESNDAKRIELESDYISKQIKPLIGRFVVLLEIEGRLISSEDLANLFTKSQNEGVKNLVFIVGGSFGVNCEVKKISNLQMSFGKNTWPHNLMKIMLMEQIFRVENMLSGGAYHH